MVAHRLSLACVSTSRKSTGLREVQASEAKTHLRQMLDDVEHGETIIITRHGRPIAPLVPDADKRREEAANAVAAIRTLRRGTGRISIAEALSMRDEGRRLYVSFVLDACVSGCRVFDDKDHLVVDAALGRTCQDGIIVPGLWWFELRNLLIVAERRIRLTAGQTSMFLAQLKRLDLTIDRAPDGDVIIPPARRRGLTVYDASYLELAIRAAIPLATLDKKLAAAAQAEGVPLIA